jgi:transposase-like protein
MLNFKGRQFEKIIILTAVRWYVAYALSYRNIEEMMKERGIAVDHATINRLSITHNFYYLKNPGLTPRGSSFTIQASLVQNPLVPAF